MVLKVTKVFLLMLVLKGEKLPPTGFGVSGVFFDTKSHNLASWVIRDGKLLYPFPYWVTHQRGSLVVFKDGRWVVKLISANEALNLSKDPSGIKLAISGGGYFIRKGKIPTHKELRDEGLSPHIINSKHFTFLAFKPDGRCGLGVSQGKSLREVATKLKKLGFVDAIRLDGGGATAFWQPPHKFPANTTNLIVTPIVDGDR